MHSNSPQIILKSRFRKDYARCSRRGWDMSLIDDAMRILARDRHLPQEYNDHPLKFDKKGCRECHIGGPHSDWLLVYRWLAGQLILEFIQTGTHRELDLGS